MSGTRFACAMLLRGPAMTVLAGGSYGVGEKPASIGRLSDKAGPPQRRVQQLITTFQPECCADLEIPSWQQRSGKSRGIRCSPAARSDDALSP
jgi:hypothetical protein